MYSLKVNQTSEMDLLRVILLFSTVTTTLTRPSHRLSDVYAKTNIESLRNEQSISFTQNNLRTTATSTEANMTSLRTTRRKTLCGTICKLQRKLQRIFGEINTTDLPVWVTTNP